jgi:hypothetical protein
MHKNWVIEIEKVISTSKDELRPKSHYDILNQRVRLRDRIDISWGLLGPLFSAQAPPLLVILACFSNMIARRFLLLNDARLASPV